MIIFLFFVVTIAIFIYLVFTKPVEISFWLGSNEMDMNLDMSWLKFIRIRAETVEYRTYVSAYIFKSRLYYKLLKKNGKKFDTDMLRALSLSDTRLETHYGLSEPHITGIVFGALSFIASMVGVESFEQYPEFISNGEYLQVDGSSKLNIGKTIKNYVQLKLRERKRRKNYGSVSVKQ